MTSYRCVFTKSNFLNYSHLDWTAHVFPPVFGSVFPIDADSGEDQNNRPKSVWSWWHWAVSRGQGQDRLLQSTGEITAAAITTGLHSDRTRAAHLLSLSLFLSHFLSSLHTTYRFLFPITRATVRCPSAWPRLTCPCPTCPTRRVRPLDSFCQSEMFVLALEPASSTHLWERYVPVVLSSRLMLTSVSVPHSSQSQSFLKVTGSINLMTLRHYCHWALT